MDHSKVETLENENHIEALLFRYLRGTVTDEEIAEVERWMSASPENRKIVEQLCVVDFAHEALQCIRSAKPWRSLDKAKQKIRKNKVRRIVAWSQRVAAVAFIPLLVVTIRLSQRPAEAIVEQPQIVEINSAPGQITSVTLPDSSKVWLNGNSQIKYPTHFSDTREVSVAGELYFAVAKNPAKPFYVNVNNAFKIKVTGTEFNVEAYPSAADYSTTLVEGAIEMVSASASAKTLLAMKPGEQSVWNTGAKAITVRNVNAATLGAWKDGKIIFRDAPIAEIAATLAKRYNARFVISQRLKDYRFTGTFTNLQLLQILEHFRISSNIRYNIKGLDVNPDGTVNNTIVELK